MKRKGRKDLRSTISKMNRIKNPLMIYFLALKKLSRVYIWGENEKRKILSLIRKTKNLKKLKIKNKIFFLIVY